jgi:hypothetical protein
MFPVPPDLPTFIANDWSEIYRKLTSASYLSRDQREPVF